MQEQVNDTFPYHPAGFWVRFCANLLDGLILLPIGILTLVNFFILKNVFILIAIGLIGLTYKPVMEALIGATLGKLALGIKVIDEKGNKIGLLRAYVRFIPFLLVQVMGIINSLFVFYSPLIKSWADMEKIGQIPQMPTLQIIVMLCNLIVVIDCVVVAFTYRKRALHDMLASSYCVYRLPINRG